MNEGSLLVGERTVPAEIHVPNRTPSTTTLEALAHNLTAIEALDAINRVDIAADLAAQGESAYFLRELDERLAEAGRELIATADLPQRLALIRIALYPESADFMLTFDYAVDTDGVSDELLVVRRGMDGALTGIAVES